jgi:magnesium transporter
MLGTDNRVAMIDVYEWSPSGVVMTGSDFRGGPPDDPHSWVWIDVVAEDTEMIREIGATFGLDANAVEESFNTTSLPLVEEHAREIFVVMHGFAIGAGERLSTPKIDVFIGERFLITIHEGDRATVEVVKNRLAEEGAIPISGPAAFLAFMARTTGRQYTPLIQELERQVDGLEEIAIRGDPQTAVEAHALRRDVILLKRALGPQYDVYDDLAESTHPAIDAEARQLFARVANQHRRALESLEAGRALLGSVLDTYRGAVADQTNEIMRILTVFSAILLPLALITGLWGMNFHEIPGATSEYGFWILFGVMVLLAGGLWVYFARRGFIGAPRVKDLPKAVGLGVYSLGSAPFRAVAGGIKKMGRTDD